MTIPAPRIAVLGAGAFGTALAIVAARSGRPVTLWGRDQNAIAAMATAGENTPYLPGAALPPSLHPSADLAAALTADVLILAVPTQNLRAAASQIADQLRPGTPLIAAAKGIEQSTGCFVMEILSQACPEAEGAILSGPSFAADMARGLPTAVTLAARDAARAKELAAAIASPGLRLYHTDDVTGVEIGGAAKNVLAIAAGIVIGAGLGESARAALIARGFAELRRLAHALGARGDTLMGLSGLGDLVLTASSPQSRNFAFGHALGRGEAVTTASHGKLAEGAFTAPALVRLAQTHGVDMPISAAVSAVIAGRLSVRDATTTLLSRPSKSE